MFGYFIFSPLVLLCHGELYTCENNHSITLQTGLTKHTSCWFINTYTHFHRLAPIPIHTLKGFKVTSSLECECVRLFLREIIKYMSVQMKTFQHSILAFLPQFCDRLSCRAYPEFLANVSTRRHDLRDTLLNVQKKFYYWFLFSTKFGKIT